jgi:hypothetical protein
MGTIYTVDFVNKTVLEVRDVPTIIVTQQMVRDVCSHLSNTGMAVTATSIQLHLLVTTGFDIDSRDIQDHLYGLVIARCLEKNFDGKTFIGYKYIGPNMRIG